MIIFKRGSPSPLKSELTILSQVLTIASKDCGISMPQNPIEVTAITGHKNTKMLMRYTPLRTEDLVERLE
jgi:hypothetical protein